MVIVKLQGGLGNQLFQYAIGRCLSIKNNDSLVLDNSFLNIKNASGYTLRDYELGIFPINPRILNQEKYFGRSLLSRVRTAFSGIKQLKERSFRFMPEVLTARGDLYLEGYWQSEKYFSEIADTLRTDLTFSPPLNQLNENAAVRISSCEAVSIHIRRTDYLSPDGSSTYHHNCTVAYYLDAIARIIQAVPQAVFFVFSDDIGWVKQNLPIAYPHFFIDHNRGKQSYLDMQLMSQCKHHIIANSSFSWWAAWLNRYEKKIVIAPERWFTDPGADTADLLPESWLKL